MAESGNVLPVRQTITNTLFNAGPLLMSHPHASKMNLFAAAAFGFPYQYRRNGDLQCAVVSFVVRHAGASKAPRSTGASTRADYRVFWYSVAKLAVYLANDDFEAEAERLLNTMRSAEPRLLCSTAHMEFFRLLLCSASSQMEPYFDGLWSSGAAFQLPNDARAVAAALKPLSTLVWRLQNSDGAGARDDIAWHLRQLHQRPTP